MRIGIVAAPAWLGLRTPPFPLTAMTFDSDKFHDVSDRYASCNLELAMHMEILLAGQSRPVGPKAEQFPDVISYFPSIWEWMVFMLSIAVMLLLFSLGERFLKLEAKPA
jgi:hypothetical protein